MTKSELRNDMLNKRSQLSSEDVLERSKRIIDQIRLDAFYQNAQTVALFYPMGQEVNLLALLQDHKTFVFPRVEKDGLHFYPYTQSMKWMKSAFGVMEPQSEVSAITQIDYMLAPALIISKAKYRIGYGKAYYDRYLHRYRPKRVVGVIYDFQEIDTFDIDAHDEPLDDVIKG
jgi:5-formyltetrahydrofolate cyclo-ligase